MRKRIVGLNSAGKRAESDHGWLDLEQIATVEVTSEDPAFPIESVFGSIDGPGWRAAAKGEQHVRIIFDEPVSLRRIQLRFHEAQYERMQEFVISWSPAKGGEPRAIIRQQWNFGPGGSTDEFEDYQVELPAVSALELTIQPDLSRHEAVATLASFRVA
jgi:hypothetical protein